MVKTEKALVELTYRHHVETVFRYCLFKTNSYHDAEDLTTEVFAKLLSGKANHIPEDKLIGWLFKVAENECKMFFRKQKKRQEVSLEPWEVIKVLDNYPWVEPSICQAVNKLKYIPRQVLFLKAVECHTFSEIAQILSLTEGAVKMHFYRAIKQLRTVLKNR